MKAFLLFLKATGYDKVKNFASPLLTTLIISILEVFNLSLIYPILQIFMDREGFESGRIMAHLRKFFPALTLHEASSMILVLFLGITLFRGTVSYFGYKSIFNQISSRESHFAIKEFKSLLYKDYLYFVNTPSIQIVRDIAISIPQGFSSTLQSTFLLLSETIVLMGMAFLLLLTNYQAFLVLSFLFGIAGFFYTKVISPKISSLGSERHNNSHRCIGIVQQSIEGIQQIKNSCSENYFSKVFSIYRQKQGQISANLQLFQTLPKIYFETLIVMCICGFLGYSLFLVSNRMESLVVASGFYVITVLRLLPSILRISAQYNNIVSFKDAIKVVTVLGNATKPVSFKEPSSLSFSNKITLENIFFSYGNDEVLKNINLSLLKNKCIGIMGKSGQGKTTFVNILAGLLSPLKGVIKIDGAEIPFSLIKEKLGNMVSCVPQNIYLIDEPLRQNVAFGQDEPVINDQKVIECLEAADLKEFLDKEKEGIKVKVGERGISISGGQRQRIGIARALYFDRDIIVFDEATSSLDEETESKICKTIESLKKKKTIIIISHRKKPLAICDEIYEMKSGNLIKI